MKWFMLTLLVVLLMHITARLSGDAFGVFLVGAGALVLAYLWPDNQGSSQ